MNDFRNVQGKTAEDLMDAQAGDGNAAGLPEASETVREPEKTAAGLFTQADVDRIVKERLEREKTARERAAQKAREEAESQALKQKQEWQTLAEMNATRAGELQARLGELEPLGDQMARYRSALEKSLADEKKDLPRHVVVLLEKLDPVEQLEYLAVNRAELGRDTRPEGVPATPAARQRSLSEDELDAARRGQAALYQNF